MSKRVLVAPDKFKGSLTALEVASAVARGLGDGVDVEILPLADGGDGTVAAAVHAGFEQPGLGEAIAFALTLRPVRIEHIPVIGVDLVCATDVTNPLTGPAGAAAVFGPQKGASADDIELLDAALARFATLASRASLVSGASPVFRSSLAAVDPAQAGAAPREARASAACCSAARSSPGPTTCSTCSGSTPGPRCGPRGHRRGPDRPADRGRQTRLRRRSTVRGHARRRGDGTWSARRWGDIRSRNRQRLRARGVHARADRARPRAERRVLEQIGARLAASLR